MRAFTYQRPSSLPEAITALAGSQACPMGGGTDLLVAIQEGIAAPDTVVDLRGVARLDAIEAMPDGGLRIGAAARIADISANAVVRDRYPALAAACANVASPALRNMGTLGGNLCQRPRCWYFRRGIPCLKNGGVTCPAREGENQHLAILEGGPCYIVHPSDPAVALTALDAEVEMAAPNASVSRMPIASFFALPRDRMDSETVLRRGELVSAVILPRASAGGRQLFHKLTQRDAWDFALASVAAVRREDDTVRLVLGGVAPRPWRVSESVEEDVASGGLDDDSVAAIVERALYDAEPLSQNGYKVTLAATLLTDAIRELAA